MNARFAGGRVKLVLGLLGLAFAGLGARLVYVQVFDQRRYEQSALATTGKTFLFEPRRGDLLDARGNLLATSIFVKTVCADPTLIGTQQLAVARALAPLLHTNEAALCQRLLPTLRTNAQGKVVTNQYVVLKRKVREEDWLKIQQAMTNLSFGIDERRLTNSAERKFYRDLRLKAVHTDIVDDQLRLYPHGPLAAHLLGFTGMKEVEFAGRKLLQNVGVDGMELTLDAQLTGLRGWRATELDKRRREVVALRLENVEPRDGLSAVLTLDAVVQHEVELALAEAMQLHSPVSASCVVVRPATGEIIALASLPAYDPNQPGWFKVEERRNRVIADLMEPGSTFKVVTVSAALHEGVVQLSDRFHCENGRWLYKNKWLHDHKAYGVLTVENIIAHSSNIGAAKIALELGGARLHRYMGEFGFGERTLIPLLGEVRGIVHPTNKWSAISITRIPMGHEVAVTPLQMTMAMAAIANHGVLMRPMLVKRYQDRAGAVVAEFPPQRVRQVIGPAAARDITTALKKAASPQGTAVKASLEHYTVAGKTGTAEKPGPGGYVRGKYVSSFIGFFPADAPELCIGVFLDEPKGEHVGGQTAAPVFRRIAAQAANALDIRPDLLKAEDLADPLNPAVTNRPAPAAVARAGSTHE